MELSFIDVIAVKTLFLNNKGSYEVGNTKMDCISLFLFFE